MLKYPKNWMLDPEDGLNEFGIRIAECAIKTQNPNYEINIRCRMQDTR